MNCQLPFQFGGSDESQDEKEIHMELLRTLSNDVTRYLIFIH